MDINLLKFELSEQKKDSVFTVLTFQVLEAGLEPARPVGHYPLKIACLPNSTTPAVSIGLYRLTQSVLEQ